LGQTGDHSSGRRPLQPPVTWMARDGRVRLGRGAAL